MSTETIQSQTRIEDDERWVRLIQLCVAVGIASLLVFAYVGTFQTTISDGGAFKHTADYWYTATGLPLSLVGMGLALGVHKLQHGADGRLGTIGTGLNLVALAALFVQLSASLLAGAEEQWGPSYIVSTFATFLGTALLAAGSWRTGVLPRAMLAIWPMIWVLGTFAAQGPTPLLLIPFFIALAVRVTRQVGASQGKLSRFRP